MHGLMHFDLVDFIRSIPWSDSGMARKSDFFIAQWPYFWSIEKTFLQLAKTQYGSGIKRSTILFSRGAKKYVL